MSKATKANYWHYVLIVSLLIIISAIVNFSQVDKTKGDSLASLLVSQTILTDATIKLDKYSDIKSYGYVVRKTKNNHFYYYFPLGTSISSIPFVLAARTLLDADMHNKFHERYVQRKIAIFTAVISFLLMYLIAKLYLKSSMSIVIASVFWFGTSFASTMATSLWSHNFASIYALLSIYFSIKIIQFKDYKFWVVLAVCLFMAYLTRPTLSLLSISVIPALFFQNIRIGLKVSLLMLFFIILFVLFSYYEFDQILPDYYLPKRLSNDAFWQAMYANLLSPARGLFIFSPFLLFIVLNFKTNKTIFTHNKLMRFLGIWVLIHLLVISRFPTWWAGYSFGARFMSDVLPAFLLLTILFIKYDGLHNKYIKIVLLVTGLFAIYINSYQALFNKYTELWNGSPSVDKYNEYVFDWKYPQFLHDKERYQQRIDEFNLKKFIALDKSMSKDLFAKKIFHNSKDVVYVGWSNSSTTQRWSLDNKSEIFFKFDNSSPLIGLLQFNIRTLEKQFIKVFINSELISSKSIDTYNQTINIEFNPELIQKGKLNVIKFQFSNPHSPKSNKNDKRNLAMALRWFLIK